MDSPIGFLSDSSAQLCGIVFGILLGMVMLKFGNISIGLGSAGGLLIMGILIGFFSSIRLPLNGFPLQPALIGYAFGHYILKLNPVLLLGSLTGAMTSTPSLNIVTSAAKSSIPALGYAGTYTFANVFLTFAGTIIMML